MTAAVPPAHVLLAHTEALAAVNTLGTLADERQVIVAAVAEGTRAVRHAAPGIVELTVIIDVDTLQAIEDAAELALPEVEPASRAPLF